MYEESGRGMPLLEIDASWHNYFRQKRLGGRAWGLGSKKINRGGGEKSKRKKNKRKERMRIGF